MKISRIKELRAFGQSLLEIDRWDANAYEDQLEASREFGGLLEKGIGKVPTAYGLFLDIFTLLFSGESALDKDLEPQGALAINAAVLDTLWGMREFQQLRGECQWTRTAVTIAILHLGTTILDAIPEDLAKKAKEAHEQQQQQQQNNEPGPGDPDPNSNKGATQPGQDGESTACSPGLQNTIEQALRRLKPELAKTLRETAVSASLDVKNAKALCASQGWALDDIPLGDEDSGSTWDACKALLSSTELRDVFDSFGNKLRNLAVHAQSNRPVKKGMTVSYIDRGDDPTRIPPDELWPLAHPKLKVLLAQQLIDGTAPQLMFKDIFDRHYGDMIALVDVSGSTQGQVSQFIKGAVLGLQAIARGQGRSLKVIPFSGKAHETIDLTKSDLTTLEALASLGAAGGTNFELALLAAVEEVKKGSDPDNPPDVVMFTDGDCPIPPHRYKDTKQERKEKLRRELDLLGAKVHVVYIGTTPEGLRYHDLRDIAGRERETFLSSLRDWETVAKVYEQL